MTIKDIKRQILNFIKYFNVTYFITGYKHRHVIYINNDIFLNDANIAKSRLAKLYFRLLYCTLKCFNQNQDWQSYNLGYCIVRLNVLINFPVS